MQYDNAPRDLSTRKSFVRMRKYYYPSIRRTDDDDDDGGEK